MTKRQYSQYRWMRKIAIILAAAPLFQLSQCQTGMNQVFANVFNALPVTISGIIQSFVLIPFQLIAGGGV